MHQGWDEHQALASRSRAALLEVLRADGGALGVEELADMTKVAIAARLCERIAALLPSS